MAGAVALGLCACSAGGPQLRVAGQLPNPIFQVAGGALGRAPCLTGFRIAPLRPTTRYATSSWSIRRPHGCDKAAQVIYGVRPEGWVDRYPGEEGVIFYPSIRWPAVLAGGDTYVVTTEFEGGRRAMFNVEFAADGARVTKAK